MLCVVYRWMNIHISVLFVLKNSYFRFLIEFFVCMKSLLLLIPLNKFINCYNSIEKKKQLVNHPKLNFIRDTQSPL